MSFDIEKKQYADHIWDPLNILLSDNAVALFYGLQPLLEGRTPTRKQGQAEGVLAAFKDKAEALDSKAYTWEYYMDRMVTILAIKAQTSGAETTIQSFLDDYFSTWWRASDPGKLLTFLGTLRNKDHLINLMKSSPTFIMKIMQFLAWYRDNQRVLKACNYHAFYGSFIMGPDRFLDEYLGFLAQTEALRAGAFSLNSPPWYAFVTHVRDTHSVNLLPNQQEIEDGMATLKVVEGSMGTYPKLLHRPMEYFRWGFQEKFMWDLDHDAEFRARIFKQDKEIEDKYNEMGGATDELADWIRSRS